MSSNSSATRIRLPNDWNPTPHQRKLWDFLELGGKRAAAVWHRRAGKDSLALNRSAIAAHERVGMYWHMLPEAAQGRKVIWDGIDRHGRRMIDQAFPPAIRKRTNSTEMKIEFLNGSIWQVVGSDNYNSLIGANPVGVVFSEYSVSNPAAWNYLRPILAENDGWALFIYTARGRNHGATLYEAAKVNPLWFAEILTVDDTNVIGPEVIAEERRSGMPEEMIEQEYYCSFAAALVGAYYGRDLVIADREGRIRAVEYDPALPVNTAWDLGWTDDTAIWFFQVHRGEIRVIDYYAVTGARIEQIAKVLHDRGYKYDRHFAPHDAKPKTLASGGRSIMEQFYALDIEMHLAPNLAPQDGIQAVRAIMPRLWFDAEKCKDGLEALRQYQRQWDEARLCFKDAPRHDWTSHAADALRYLAVSYREWVEPEDTTPKPIDTTPPTLNDLWKHRGQQRTKRL